MEESLKGPFGLYVSILGRTARGYFRRELAPYGLGPGQQAYLLALFPGETVHQDEIARRLEVDKANVTRAVGGLERLGYVIRRRDPADRRAWLLSLTGTGEDVRRSVETVSARWLDLLGVGISRSDWNCTEKTLGRIAARAVRLTDGLEDNSSERRKYRSVRVGKLPISE